MADAPDKRDDAAAPSSDQPAADNSTNAVSQAELDALLAQVQPDTPAQPQGNEVAAPSTSNLIDQAELDSLAAQLQRASDPPPPAAQAGDTSPHVDIEAEMAAALAAEGGDKDKIEAEMAAALAAECGPVPSADGADDEARIAAAVAAADAARESGPAVIGAKVTVSPDDAIPMSMPEFPSAEEQDALNDLDVLDDVELDVRIELGRTQMYIEEVLRLGEGAVVELDKLAGDPVDIFVNERLIARGEVLVLNDNFCVRINEIISPTLELEEQQAQ
jgi:flagellar motor switch protein FliN/FliY